MPCSILMLVFFSGQGEYIIQQEVLCKIWEAFSPFKRHQLVHVVPLKASIHVSLWVELLPIYFMTIWAIRAKETPRRALLWGNDASIIALRREGLLCLPHEKGATEWIPLSDLWHPSKEFHLPSLCNHLIWKVRRANDQVHAWMNLPLAPQLNGDAIAHARECMWCGGMTIRQFSACARFVSSCVSPEEGSGLRNSNEVNFQIYHRGNSVS